MRTRVASYSTVCSSSRANKHRPCTVRTEHGVPCLVMLAASVLFRHSIMPSILVCVCGCVSRCPFVSLQAPRAVRNAQRKRAEALQRQQQQLLQQTYEQQQQQRLLGQLPPTAQLPGYQPAQLPPQLQQLQQLGGQAGPSRIMQNLDPTGQLTLQLQLPIGQLGTGQLQGTGQLPGAGQQPGLPPYFM